MMDSDKMYRLQKCLLVSILISLMVAFSFILFPGLRLYSYSAVSSSQFQESIRFWNFHFKVAKLVMWLALILYLSRTYLFYKAAKIGLSWNDERTRINRLRAFRPAFFVVFFAQIIPRALDFFPSTAGYLPGQPYLAIIGGLIVLIGMELFNNREMKHESNRIEE